MRWATVGALAVIGLLAIGVGAGHAQRIFAGFYGTTPPRFPNANSFQGGFTFCRAMFTSNRREKRGWDTDYPGADINFSIRLSELTKTRTIRQPTGTDPEYVVVRLTDPALFHCPYVLMEDAGTIFLRDDEIAPFREYLLKGGFVFVSDYWGAAGEGTIRRGDRSRAAAADFPIVDVPLGHPLWHTQFQLDEVPQMPSIQSWRRSGGNTDRGVTDRPRPGHHRRSRPPDGRDDPQLGYSGWLGARGRGSAVLLPVLAARLRRRHRHLPLRDNSLNPPVASAFRRKTRSVPCLPPSGGRPVNNRRARWSSY
jgi:hypothetical protein